MLCIDFQSFIYKQSKKGLIMVTVWNIHVLTFWKSKSKVSTDQYWAEEQEGENVEPISLCYVVKKQEVLMKFINQGMTV